MHDIYAIREQATLADGKPLYDRLHNRIYTQRSAARQALTKLVNGHRFYTEGEGTRTLDGAKFTYRGGGDGQVNGMTTDLRIVVLRMTGLWTQEEKTYGD